MADTAQTRREVRSLLERHGLRPRKRLGQHFLADPNIVDKIVRVAGIGPGDRVVEIGPGTGTLTAALAAAGARVLAIEIDEGLAPVLAETVGGSDLVEVRFGDAARIDLAAELDDGPWALVANLPYNVGTPIVLDVLRHVPTVTRIVVMVQAEVAGRFAAEPGTGEYGLPSVVVGLHAAVRGRFDVPPQVFVPPPTVGSTVIALERRGADPRAERAIELAAAAFGQRRKMLRSSLAGVLADPVAALEAAGIDPTERPERLPPTAWLELVDHA
ncbi:MAG: 16S rRNA (adenine(1518)-N(6)/adenine(1519)-N(6))-dimethyltransferase RsmA [Acidimicrobiia bacterium]